MDVLQDDLVRKCLLGVTYKSHDDLKAVCRSWEAMVSNPKFYADRKISGTSEQVICLIRRDRRDERAGYMPDLKRTAYVSGGLYAVTVYDPVKGTWETLPPIDDPKCPGIPKWCQCVAVNRKLVVIGGLRPSRTSHRAMKTVYIYDFVSARWSRGADMPTARYCFASSVSSSTGLIYVAGGTGTSVNRPPFIYRVAAAEAYNVEEDRWEILPPMIEPRGYGCQGVFMEGKFMVISGSDPSNRSAEVFDPSARTWSRCEDMWISLREIPLESYGVAASSSDLYVFTQRDIMKYDAEKKVWTAVVTLPRDIHSAGRVTEWRDSLFISGFDNLNNEAVYYLLNPSTGQLIEVNSDGRRDIAISARTVEI